MRIKIQKNNQTNKLLPLETVDERHFFDLQLILFSEKKKITRKKQQHWYYSPSLIAFHDDIPVEEIVFS
jgi:hypothetical protein